MATPSASCLRPPAVPRAAAAFRFPSFLPIPTVTEEDRGIRNVVTLMESIWFPSLLPPLTPQLLPRALEGLRVSVLDLSRPESPFLFYRRGYVASATCLRPADRCPPCSPHGCCPKPSAGCRASMGWRSPGSWTPPRSRKISAFINAA